MKKSEYLLEAKKDFISLLEELKDSGVINDFSITSWLSKLKNNQDYIKETTEKYNNVMEPEEWCNVNITGVNNFEELYRRRNKLISKWVVHFDTGASHDGIDWELDWSFDTHKSKEEINEYDNFINIIDKFSKNYERILFYITEN